MSLKSCIVFCRDSGNASTSLFGVHRSTRLWAVAGVALSVLALFTQPGLAATHNVSNASQLQTALSSANGGDQIVLASGNYGGVTVSGKTYSNFVTIRSANPSNAALLTSLTVVNSRYLEFADLRVARTTNGGNDVVILVDNSDDIRIIGCEIRGPVDSNFAGPRYGIHIVNGSNRVRVENCNLHNLLRGTFAVGASNIEYAGNSWDYLGEDGIDFSSVNGLLIENNDFGGHHFQQPGGHMDFIQGSGGNSSNVTIRGNVMIGRNVPNIQGIFLGDATYTNALIEQNVVYTGMGHGIRIDGGSNLTVRHNTVLHAEGTLSTATYISGPSGMVKTGNIYVNWQLSSGNLVIPTAGELAANYAMYFDDPVSPALNENHSVFNFIPKPGSAADNPNMGAWHRINELTGFAGGNQAPNVSVIAQTPDDHVSGTPGSQILVGTAVTYSGSATDSDGDPLTWQWLYKINGGSETLHSSGSNTVSNAQFTYGAGTAGQTFEWILRVSDGTLTRQSTRFTQIVTDITPPETTGTVLGWDQIEMGIDRTPIIWLADPQPDAVSFYVKGVFIRTDDTGPDDPGSGQFQVWPPVTLALGDEIRAEWDGGQTHTVYAVGGSFPALSLVGLNPAKVSVGGTYNDAGATAHDFQDGNITSSVSMTSNVNTAVPGEFTVTYNVMDSNGNPAVPLQRLVRVVGSQFNVTYLWEEGQTLQVTVPSLAMPPIQWLKGSMALMDDGRIEGSMTETLTISPLAVSDTGTYSVSIDDGTKGSVTLGTFSIKVVPAGSLPASRLPLLVLLAVGLIALSAAAIRRMAAGQT